MSGTNHIDKTINTYVSIYEKISEQKKRPCLSDPEISSLTVQLTQIVIILEKLESFTENIGELSSKQSDNRASTSTESSNKKDNSSSEESENKKMKRKNLILFIFSIVPFFVILIYISALSVPRIFPELMVTPTPEITSDPSPSPKVTETPNR